MPLIRMPNSKPPSREILERAFEIAEASSRLEGLEPGPRYYALKDRVLAGEITGDEAVEILTARGKMGFEARDGNSI